MLSFKQFYNNYKFVIFDILPGFAYNYFFMKKKSLMPGIQVIQCLLIKNSTNNIFRNNVLNHDIIILIEITKNECYNKGGFQIAKSYFYV